MDKSNISRVLCGTDEGKSEEACRLLELFIAKALETAGAPAGKPEE